MPIAAQADDSDHMYAGAFQGSSLPDSSTNSTGSRTGYHQDEHPNDRSPGRAPDLLGTADVQKTEQVLSFYIQD